ncbi:MAG TPA: hypothetical protein VMP11_15920 [Verrucomicrobiae bacterium]|nr:hypothetical protein [Verrucomicrobiae bacterium]
MNDEQLNELFRTARASHPDTSRAEYGFETRLLAVIRGNRKQPMPLAALAWRLMPVFAVIVLVTGVWSYNIQSEMGMEATLGTGDEAALSRLSGGE